MNMCDTDPAPLLRAQNTCVYVTSHLIHSQQPRKVFFFEPRNFCPTTVFFDNLLFFWVWVQKGLGLCSGFRLRFQVDGFLILAQHKAQHAEQQSTKAKHRHRAKHKSKAQRQSTKAKHKGKAQRQSTKAKHNQSTAKHSKAQHSTKQKYDAKQLTIFNIVSRALQSKGLFKNHPKFDPPLLSFIF